MRFPFVSSRVVNGVSDEAISNYGITTLPAEAGLLAMTLDGVFNRAAKE